MSDRALFASYNVALFGEVFDLNHAMWVYSVAGKVEGLCHIACFQTASCLRIMTSNPEVFKVCLEAAVPAYVSFVLIFVVM
jgi:hypothetical protein